MSIKDAFFQMMSSYIFNAMPKKATPPCCMHALSIANFPTTPKIINHQLFENRAGWKDRTSDLSALYMLEKYKD